MNAYIKLIDASLGSNIIAQGIDTCYTNYARHKAQWRWLSNPAGPAGGGDSVLVYVSGMSLNSEIFLKFVGNNISAVSTRVIVHAGEGPVLFALPNIRGPAGHFHVTLFSAEQEVVKHADSCEERKFLFEPGWKSLNTTEGHAGGGEFE